MDFITKFEKELEKSGTSVGAGSPPAYWFSSGSYALNRILSGSFYKAVPQGRLVMVAGPPGSGKSFICANIMREAQKDGAHVINVDSENSADDNFVEKIGVNTKESYTYVDVLTISQAKKSVSTIVKAYKTEYGEDEDAPKVLIVIDSLDMLETETEQEHFAKGVTKGDMGQRAKQLKSMLRSFVQAIKRTNISIVVTHQVYQNQDLMNGEGLWKLNDAIRYSPSLIILVTKLKLKTEDKSSIIGIRMKCEGYKTRFTQPFQTVTIKVPYESGIDPYSGMLDIAVQLGVVRKAGSWYYHGEEKFYKKDFNYYAPEVVKECEDQRDKYIEALVEDDEVDLTPQLSARKQRLQNFEERGEE